MKSAASCRRRSTCRLCGSRDLALAFALTPTPPANAFVSAADKDKPQAVFPLDLFFCRACAHLQLLDVVDPKVLSYPDASIWLSNSACEVAAFGWQGLPSTSKYPAGKRCFSSR